MYVGYNNIIAHGEFSDQGRRGLRMHAGLLWNHSLFYD